MNAKQASLQTMVQNECANHVAAQCIMLDGECPVIEGKRCAVRRDAMGHPTETAYFDRCVLPLADTRPEFAGAARMYRAMSGTSGASERNCPDCGNGLLPRQRVCPSCKIARRRAAYRRNWRKRNATPQLSAFVPIGRPVAGVRSVQDARDDESKGNIPDPAESAEVAT
jgi:hypothetical protein